VQAKQLLEKLIIIKNLIKTCNIAYQAFKLVQIT